MEIDLFNSKEKIIDTLNTPTFSCRSPRIWNEYLNKNQNAYGRAILKFANIWATEMELKMNGGIFKDLSNKDINDCSEKADNILGGITGFMYGRAIKILSDTWKYGNELDEWNERS